MNKLKRFGTIYLKDMTKEIEKTIASDENQFKKLYNRIEELEEDLNKKNIKIKLLEDEIEAYKLQIETLKSLYEKNDKSNNNENGIEVDYSKIQKMMQEDDIKKDTNIEDKSNGPKLLNFNKMKEALNREKNVNILSSNHIECKPHVNIPTPSTSFNNLSKEENKIKFRVTVNKLILIIRIKNILNNKRKKQKHFSENVSCSAETEQVRISNTHKKVRPERNKELPILERYKVKVYNNEDLKNSELLQFVGSEDCFLIEYQYKISEKIKKNIENISIDDVIDFKIKYEGYRNTRTRRTELRHLITRSKILFEKYGKKLCRFKVSLSHIRIMSDEDWEEWLIEFDELFNSVLNSEKICDYKYKNGKQCGKMNCKIKHRENS